jgi:hypothetical protein
MVMPCRFLMVLARPGWPALLWADCNALCMQVIGMHNLLVSTSVLGRE